jgi:murein DD-endopeptidase MepM/ murein hydrolase activator NlpD
MMRRSRWMLAAFLACGLVVGAKPPAEKDVRTKLIKTREKLKMSKQQLDEANKQERELADDLGVTEEQLVDFSDRLREIRTELSLARSRHEVIRRSVIQSRSKLRSKRRALGARLRDMEMEGSASYLQVLLQARTFTQFLTYTEYIQRVVDSERELIAAVRHERELLERRREAAQRTVNEINGLEHDFRTKVSQLNEVQEKQALLLAKLQSHRRKLQSYVVGLEHITVEMEAKLQAMLRSRRGLGYNGGPIPAGSGRFKAPVQGPITSPFGYRIHPVLGYARLHSGLDYGVDHGTGIHAADNGVVIVAEWYGGYGNCIIIQHSNDLSTLYGHCSSLYVKNGDTVRQGQTIAAVGSTGMSTGPHLHFEVRQAGTPVDPLSYL